MRANAKVEKAGESETNEIAGPEPVRPKTLLHYLALELSEKYPESSPESLDDHLDV